MNTLLTRDEFRNAVFSRDNHQCVVCKFPAQDAHHIFERRLWPDGGYYLNNGASLCERCHILAEQTLISVEELLKLINAKRILPPHLYDDQIYDKWGNIILPNNTRLKGELFYDESVQKVLGKVINTFVDYVKYPRTYHLPWSESISDDDRIFSRLDNFTGQRVIITEKMDGENTSMYKDGIHARSVDSGGHDSRNWVKQFWSKIRFDIPNGWRICGENLYAKHSIHYENLKTYFMGFSIWNNKNVSLSWDDTQEWFNLLNIVSVPVLYDGIYNKEKVAEITKNLDRENSEGYVIRLAKEIPYSQFRTSVAKYVRKNHISSENHWFFGKKMVVNNLG